MIIVIKKNDKIKKIINVKKYGREMNNYSTSTLISWLYIECTTITQVPRYQFSIKIYLHVEVKNSTIFFLN